MLVVDNPFASSLYAGVHEDSGVRGLGGPGRDD